MSEKREGALFYDKESGRYDIRFGLDSFYGGLHCGDCFDLKVDNAWVPARIEMGDEWYLAGLPRMSLDGLIVGCKRDGQVFVRWRGQWSRYL